jgi:acylphosphatase
MIKVDSVLKERIKMINLFQKSKGKSSPIPNTKKVKSRGGLVMKKVRMTAVGRVQGVGFRFMTKMVADQIGVFGSVKNQADGSVYIEANGDSIKIDKFIEKIKKSPSPSGKVNHLEITEDSSLPERIKFSITN